MSKEKRLVRLIYCFSCCEDTVHCETLHGDIRCEICGCKRYPLPFQDKVFLFKEDSINKDSINNYHYI